MGYAERLGERLRSIEEAAGAFDAGDRAGGAARIAVDLAAVFQAAPTLLSQLGASYVKLVSSVPKSPYPAGKFAPLTEVTIDLGGGAMGASTGQAAGYPPPTFHARLGPTRNLRTVQAPDWWRSEPVFLVDHSRVSRRDVVQAATGAPAEHLSDLLLKAGWTGCSVSPYAEYAWLVPVREAASAAVRQVAHEVLNSPDLRKLAQAPAGG